MNDDEKFGLQIHLLPKSCIHKKFLLLIFSQKNDLLNFGILSVRVLLVEKKKDGDIPGKVMATIVWDMQRFILMNQSMPLINTAR
jgi:hypothetical protein